MLYGMEEEGGATARLSWEGGGRREGVTNRMLHAGRPKSVPVKLKCVWGQALVHRIQYLPLSGNGPCYSRNGAFYLRNASRQYFIATYVKQSQRWGFVTLSRFCLSLGLIR